MPASLVRTCPLCGLRFSNTPLLELHIREDHPGENAGPSGTTATQPRPATRPGRPQTAEAPGRLSPASSRYSRYSRHTA